MAFESDASSFVGGLLDATALSSFLDGSLTGILVFPATCGVWERDTKLFVGTSGFETVTPEFMLTGGCVIAGLVVTAVDWIDESVDGFVGPEVLGVDDSLEPFSAEATPVTGATGGNWALIFQATGEATTKVPEQQPFLCCQSVCFVGQSLAGCRHKSDRVEKYM